MSLLGDAIGAIGGFLGQQSANRTNLKIARESIAAQSPAGRVRSGLEVGLNPIFSAGTSSGGASQSAGNSGLAAAQALGAMASARLANATAKETEQNVKALEGTGLGTRTLNPIAIGAKAVAAAPPPKGKPQSASSARDVDNFHKWLQNPNNRKGMPHYNPYAVPNQTRGPDSVRHR
jgi:hypothetical protein